MRRHPDGTPALKKFVFLFIAAALQLSPALASEPKSQVYSHFLNALLLEKNGELERALSEYNRSLELEPQAGAVLRQRASLHMKMGNPEKALADTQAIVKQRPQDAESLKLLANIYLMRGQAEQARLALEKVLELDPKDSQSLMDLSLILITEDPPAAAKSLEKLSRMEPDSSEVFYHLGLAHQKTGDEEKSAAAFKRVVELDPSSLPALFLLGQMKEKAGKTEEAIALYESALEKMPDNSSLRMQIVMLHAGRSDLASVERVLEYFKDDANAPVEANLWLGVTAESRKDWDAALQYYLKAQAQADNPEIHIRLASIYSHLGKVGETLESLKTLIDKNPLSAQYRYFMGLAYLDLKKPKKAIPHFTKAVELKADFSSAYFQLGVAHDQLGDWAKAEALFRQAVAVDTANASAYNYIGYSLADRKENLFEARRMIERALELDHDNPAFIDSLGWLNFREGNFTQALMHLTSAAEKISDPVILDHLGDCYAALGQVSEAALAYSKSLELEPGSKPVQKKLDALHKFLVPTSPARKILKAFEFRLKQATNISGPFFVKRNFIAASRNFSQGVFYLRHEDTLVAVSTALRTEVRVDFLNSVLVPSVILRYRSLPSALTVFPPEFRSELPQETDAALETMAAFLNGQILSDLDGPQTAVKETGRQFILTRGGIKVVLDKAEGVVRELQTPGCRIQIAGYRKMGDISLPETLEFDLAGRKFQIRFTTLSLDKIESQVFSEDPRPR